MMQQLPDAPWIRDAERNGYPEAPDVHCPVCGEDCERVYIFDGDVIACDRCYDRYIKEVDSWEWWEAEKDDSR